MRSPFLNPAKTVWVPHLRRGFMRLRWVCRPSPGQLLPLFLSLPLLLPLFLLLFLFFLTHPEQTSSRPKGAHFAAAVERSLYFVFCSCLCSCRCSCLCCCCCSCRLSVLRRHSERSEEPPHFQGERSDPSAFLFRPTPGIVISTGATGSPTSALARWGELALL